MLVRSKLVWTTFGIVVVGCLSVSGIAYYRVNSIKQSGCADIPPPDLSIQHWGDLRARLRAYQNDETPDAYITLEADEIVAIYDDAVSYDLLLEFKGDRTRAKIKFPLESGCYQIEFEGKVSIEGNVAQMVPTKLKLGAMDLAGTMGSRRYLIGPDLVPDEKSAPIVVL